MLYDAYQAHSDWMAPLQWSAAAGARMLTQPWFGGEPSAPARKLAAAWEVFSRLRLTHERPPFGIASIQIGDRQIAVREEIVTRTPFATLLRFVRDDAPELVAGQPRLLIAAPLSGHFATLLRSTVRTALVDHDVYITDWHNAQHVPLSAGEFGLDAYTDHLIAFLEAIGPGAHLMAICQPCVSALAAVAVMAAAGNPCQPRSMTLMAGPVDTRINPTAVNTLANSKPIEWFDKHLVHRVPLQHAGAMRRVYPGFLQLSAFVSMNPARHRDAFIELYGHLANGELDKANVTREFYDEYFAVNDLHAEFYLQTVKQVFQDHSLARGELLHHGEPVDLRAIRKTALFTVEGERDDICAIGQTVAAHDLCPGVRPSLKSHHVQLGVGHYGVFSGRRWQQQIYPRVRDMIHACD